MKRVLVIGSAGAGKSTFSARLAERTGLPLVHLDALYWKPGWIEPSKPEWAAVVDRVLGNERWILDGNYAGTLERRLQACDTVIFLDLPRAVCLWRVLRRRVRFHGKSRPDMTPGCPERLSWAFTRWIWRYPSAIRPDILRRLSAPGIDRRVVRLRSAAAAGSFLDALPRRGASP